MSRSGSDDVARPGPCLELFGCSGGDGLPALRDLSQQAVAHALARALSHVPAPAQTGTRTRGASCGVTGDAIADATADASADVSGCVAGDVPWPVAVDGTAGNGHDTLFLARLVGARGLVHAFDVQPRALARTAERLAAQGLEERVALHGRGHEELAAVLASQGAWPSRITAAMFNLGFLPGSDRSVTTRSETTLTALEALLPLVVPGGIVSLHVYAGHPGGADEAAALDRRLAELDWNRWRVARYELVNKPRNPERLLLLLRLPGLM